LATSTINYANGSTATALGSTSLSIPNNKSITALVVADQDLQQDALISLSDVCRQGLEIKLTNTSLELLHKNQIVASSQKLESDTLWSFPLQSFNPQVNVAIHHEFNAEKVAFFHAAIGSPPISTFLRAIEKGYLSGIPWLTTALVRKNPPISLAIDQGHLQRNRQGYRSTKPLPIHITPPSTDEENEDDPRVYFTTTPMNEAIYGDLTGQLPWKSRQGSSYLFISYRNGYIRLTPMTSRFATSYVTCLQADIKWWTEHGGLPEVYKLDNEISQSVFHKESHPPNRAT